MSKIREEMPVLVRHEGQWAGTYTTVDNSGKVIDQHQSLITCQFPQFSQGGGFSLLSNESVYLA